ncbi:MAG: hypothetical protein LBN24_06255, partial [Mediterranea sp.]|nr:hypothetical protein [Mediterranea sp.]
MANERFFPLSTLLVPFGGTFFPTQWDFFPKAVGLFSQGVGTFFPRRWDFFPNTLGLLSAVVKDSVANCDLREMSLAIGRPVRPKVAESLCLKGSYPS